ncbi:MAG TPA: undecaprenyl-diphosphate phosphatase [Phycisphaerae bacterium]|nr:undecaprenyl-diphosphate phosphatase [Phycisphaerae bacterium]HRY67459.1 undecaprenyl-diphosphate phosphatase [Phycisphaerae bacterium]HSA27948.1 undecaprenyl-diphosphate phosphatase [Phycisphaerae bacterium]
MIDVLRAVVLGVVEGLTEFLPVSSTGHMILVEPLLGIPEKDPFWSGTFDVFIQIGAILAVAALFWTRLWKLTFEQADALRRRHAPVALSLARPGPLLGLLKAFIQEHILGKILVAFLPAVIIGKLTADFIEAHMKTTFVVACALVVGGVAILLIEYLVRDSKVTDAASVTLTTAFLIGVAQCLAMVFPGTSRSAATIMGALLLGLSSSAAAEFSFFLAIPTMFAAGGYSLLKHINEIDSSRLVTLAVGFVVSFIVAWLVVKVFMRFIQTHRFTSFAIYRIILGIVVLGYFFVERGRG